MAPEVVRGGQGGHDFSVDWWSVGVLTYELLTGASPFTVEGERNTQVEISKRILRSNPPIPAHMSPEVQDFICRLLVKDPKLRLGGGKDDAYELKSHPFFNSIDWDLLSAKRIQPPIVPKINGELDVSNFAEEFTSMVPTDSPAILPLNDDKIFKGYSYVAPSVIFSDNEISQEIFCEYGAESTERGHENVITPEVPFDCRPNLSQVLPSIFKNSPFFKKYHIFVGESILGDGSFSICRKCVNRLTGVEYAVKIVSRKIDTSREIELLEQCQGHPNIVNLIEVFQDEMHTYIILELLKGGELLKRIRKRSVFSEIEAGQIFRGLIAAVSFMHSKGIVHRDLKPEVS